MASDRIRRRQIYFFPPRFCFVNVSSTVTFALHTGVIVMATGGNRIKGAVDKMLLAARAVKSVCQDGAFPRTKEGT